MAASLRSCISIHHHHHLRPDIHPPTDRPTPRLCTIWLITHLFSSPAQYVHHPSYPHLHPPHFGFGFDAAGSRAHPPTYPPTHTHLIIVHHHHHISLDSTGCTIRYDTAHPYIHTYIQADTVRTTDIHARSSGRSRAPPRIYRGARSIHIRYDCFLLVFIIYSVLVIWFSCTFGVQVYSRVHACVCFFRIGFAGYGTIQTRRLERTRSTC
ncbi:hypothetical protein B0H11DRAFT_1952818 [Mycena galericulata]|nr:hypothetical protein B0H11DRAFT_1952818 [Mycena galericulata]